MTLRNSTLDIPTVSRFVAKSCQIKHSEHVELIDEYVRSVIEIEDVEEPDISEIIEQARDPSEMRFALQIITESPTGYRGTRVHYRNGYLKLRELCSLASDPLLLSHSILAAIDNPGGPFRIATSILRFFNIDLDQEHAVVYLAAHAAQSREPMPSLEVAREEANVRLLAKGLPPMTPARFKIVIQSFVDMGSIILKEDGHLNVLERIRVTSSRLP